MSEELELNHCIPNVDLWFSNVKKQMIKENKMSKTKKENTEVVIDLKGAISILAKRGIENSVLGLINQSVIEVSMPTVYAWMKKAPITVRTMNFCLNQTEKSFPEIMEKVESGDKALDFILDLCNQTGLTFNEVVKEV